MPLPTNGLLLNTCVGETKHPTFLYVMLPPPIHFKDN